MLCHLSVPHSSHMGNEDDAIWLVPWHFDKYISMVGATRSSSRRERRLTFLEHLLRATHCAGLMSSNPLDRPMREVLSYPFEWLTKRSAR